MAKNGSSTKRSAAKKKRSQRGWSMRSNRTPTDPREEAETEAITPVSVADPLPSVDAPATPSMLEQMPWWGRWVLLVSIALVIGTLTGANYTVQLGLTAGLATLLAGGAFLASFLPPALRDRPGDGAAVGFGRATGHQRPSDAAEDEPPPANRAARRRARREIGE